MNYRCKWVEDDDQSWDTGCLNKFMFNNGGPPENDFEYCPYCGNKLEVQRYRKGPPVITIENNGQGGQLWIT